MVMSDNQKELIVSARKFTSIEDVTDNFRRYETDDWKIGSFFGNCGGPCRMYGGRGGSRRSPKDYVPWDGVKEINKRGIKFFITLTNHYLDDDAVMQSLKHVEKLLSISESNGIVVLNRKFAKILRYHFPDIILKQSAIANPTTLGSIEKALEIYHYVTLSHQELDKVDFLFSIPPEIKQKLVLFGNGRCAYKCMERTCYLACSQFHFGKEVTARCTGILSKENAEPVPMTVFNINHPIYTHVSKIKYIE